MDYEKKYKEALEMAQKLYQDCPNGKNDRLYHTTDLEKMFPELKEESEDERIRKAIMEHFAGSHSSIYPYKGFTKKQILDWLEKQNSNVDNANKEYWRGYREGKQEILDKYAELENQTKESNEPKFKVDDWVIDKQGIMHQIANVIENVTNHTYAYDIVGDGYFSDNTEGVRLWTIQDAKDGDVLASELCDSIILFKGINDDNNIDFYCDYDFSEIDLPGDRFSVNNGQHYGNVEDSKDFYPATKEQRDLLFQKMKEAGYEWDAEKKELKKIKQKPAWSEKDEKEYKYVLKFVDNILNNCGNKKDYEHCKRCYDWLKSLKQKMYMEAE